MGRLSMEVRGFGRSERGSMTVLSLFLLVMMILVGGMAVDLMRAEANRAHIQYTLDRAVLAAASAAQTGDREEIVNGYLAAAGIDPADVTVTIGTADNPNAVSASATGAVRSIFLDAVGVETLTTPASATASESVQSLEVALVLDMSGSMADPSGIAGKNRMQALKEAASSFVGSLSDRDPSRLSLSLVPYNHEVTLPPYFTGQFDRSSNINRRNYFNFSRWHTYSNCARFEPEDFTRTGVDPDDEIDRLGHFAHQSYNPWKKYPDYAGRIDSAMVTDPNNPSGPRIARPFYMGPWCDSRRTAVVPYSTDLTQLDAAIESLHAQGSTALEIGFKWGALLLDPSSRDRVTAMVNDGILPETQRGRPGNYRDPSVLKVIVLITDGENNERWDLRDGVRGFGSSGVFAHHPSFPAMADDEERLEYVMSDPLDPADPSVAVRFYFHEKQGAHDHYYPAGTYRDATDRLDAPPADAIELTWAQLWAIKPTHHVEKEMVTTQMPGTVRDRYARAAVPVASNPDYFGRGAIPGVPDANALLSDICEAAKAQGVVVFTIGYHLRTWAEPPLRDCATDHPQDIYYQLVSNSDIGGALDSIARTIQQLRLTR